MRMLKRLSDEELQEELKESQEVVKKLEEELRRNSKARYQTNISKEYLSSLSGSERGEHWRPSIMSETESRNSVEWLIMSDIKKANKRIEKIREIMESREQQAQKQ